MTERAELRNHKQSPPHIHQPVEKLQTLRSEAVIFFFYQVLEPAYTLTPNSSVGRAEAESSRGVTLHQCSHSGVGTKASPLGFHPSVHSRSATVQTFSGFQSPTHRCAEPRWRRPRAPDLQWARGAPPLPRCCQQPADPTVPGRTGAATLTTRADDRSHNPIRGQPALPSPPPDGGRGGTHPAAAPPPPAAAAQPEAPGTIFCRRPGLGGGYQPPQRRRQLTQPSAPGRRAPGAARSFGGCGVGRSRCSDLLAPRGDPSPPAEALGPEAA